MIEIENISRKRAQFEWYLKYGERGVFKRDASAAAGYHLPRREPEVLSILIGALLKPGVSWKCGFYTRAPAASILMAALSLPRELRGASAMQIIHRISPPCPVPTQLQLVLEYKILSLQHQLNDSIRTPRINLSLHLKAQTPKVH